MHSANLVESSRYICTTFVISAFCQHSELMCWVWLSEQRAIIFKWPVY